MTREEALDVVGMIAAHWPGNHWTQQSMDAYARAIEPLDPTVCMAAVVRAVNELDFYPKVATLREFYRIEKRLAEPDDPIERALSNTPSMLMPAWVKGWVISRVRYRDFRVWAEQDMHADDLMPAADRDRYMAEGTDVPISALFSAVGLAVE